MFKSRKEALETFLASEPCLKAFLICGEEKENIKNYYVNPGLIEGFKINTKKPLIKIRFSSFTYTLDFEKGINKKAEEKMYEITRKEFDRVMKGGANKNV